MKYDIMLDMNANDSHTIILKQIKNNTKVLEFGSANGKMTQYMKEQLGCEVYIVEKERYEFMQASKYSKDAICGDIGDFEWLKWQDIKFNYILFADVLEHISNPKEVLLKTEVLLEDDGMILISVPNITHNDVLIKAFNERFDYTPLGILDNTHVHFWGEKNIYEFINDTPYKVSNIDYTIWETGTTEQAIKSPTAADKELMNILREREFGNVYQFIFSLVKKSREENVERKNIQGNEFCKLYFSSERDFKEELGIFQAPISHEFKRYKYDFEILVPDNTSKILIKPAIGKRCVLDNLQIKLSDKVEYLCIYSQNINYGNTYCFLNNEPFIVVELVGESRSLNLKFSADVILAGDEYIDYICEGCAVKMTNEEKSNELMKKLDEVFSAIEVLEEKIDFGNGNIERCEKKSREIVNRLNESEKNNKFYLTSITNKVNSLDWKISQIDERIVNVRRKQSVILDRLASTAKKGTNYFANKNSSEIAIIASSYYFEWEWYVNKYDLKIKNGMAAAQHYMDKGWRLYYDPSPHFVTVAYFIENPDVKTADINPLYHYERDGKGEGRDIGDVEKIKAEYNLVKNSSFFDEMWYRNKYGVAKDTDAVYSFLFNGVENYQNPSMYFSSLEYLMDNMLQAEVGQNPLVHYECNKNNQKELMIKEVNEDDENEKRDEIAIIASSCYFEWEWYVNKYDLKIKNEMAAAQHYMDKGWRLYYDPSPHFVTIAYFVENPDVKTADINPLYHYERDGKGEGRDIGDVEKIKAEYNLVKNSSFFDEMWYRNKYGVAKDTDAVYSFLFNGMENYQNPSMHFSSLEYLMDNMLQAEVGQNPLVHYERNKNDRNLLIQEVSENKITDAYFEQCEIVSNSARNKLNEYQRGKVKAHTKSVDIIICVYNAYEDVKRCIDSVMTKTTEPYRIIIVDDNSEELTASYLKEISEKNSNVKLMVNTSDLHGYTYAANIGLKNSNADYCVMLNSDTIVSEHWLDNMITCAESDEKIGLVGPLSNTASWQSVPKLTEDGDWCHNIIPKGFNVSDVAKIIECNSGRIYPRVPLLNGFCLLIKREVINKIGYFDEKNFGRGFAEEDDYNTRAVKEGFDLAIADDTYIYHAQSKSYTDEKRLELCKLSGESLRKKHGQEYIDSCTSFMLTNRVLDSIRKRVEIIFEKENIYKKCKKEYSGKKILFLLPASNVSGGANVIIQESSVLIKMGIDVTILNLECNRKEYDRFYEDVKIPVIWIKDYAEFDYMLAKNYDVVVCTLFRTVEYCKFLENYDKPQIVYYIQDYEPYFIQEELKCGDYDHIEYERAKKSYTLISRCINVTKTQWNCNEVRENTGADCFVLGPSLNTNLFMPRLENRNFKVVITAMIRPNTKRRAPYMTFEVLRKLKIEFGDKIDIRIFGADAEHDLYSKLFFSKQKKDFGYTNYGLLSPKSVSILLAESDIFLDLSEFQAMGLTAMEAMACGCATIVPQSGGTGCYARNGENCLVVDSLNFEECLNNARKLILDKFLREKLGKQAYRDMTEFYPEKVVEKFLEIVFSQESRDISHEK